MAKIAFLMLVFQLVALGSSQAQEIFAAPIPTQIVAAKKVFIANGGRDSLLAVDRYTGEPYRAFNQLYGAMQKSGRFELVATPQEADLVVEVSTLVALKSEDRLVLTIFEAKSHYVLWKMDSWIELAIRQPTRDRNFDVAVNKLSADLEKLAAPQH